MNDPDPAPDLDDLEREVLARLTPTAEERQNLQDAVDGLLERAREVMAERELPGTPSVQGSIAKDTYLAGNMDIDLFLLLDPGLPPERLKDAAEDVGTTILEHPRKKYAQHPYLIGTWHGFEVDLVPAYGVAEAAMQMSAVDRTPFHTAWVQEHLDETGRRRLRLLKGWCKGVGVYGAETAQGGFSGYLLEVLLVHLGSFKAVLAWFAAGSRPRRIAVGEDAVTDDVSPLVVVDPVDPARNCAAAVTEETLETAGQAARAYQEAPTKRFWFPRPPRAEPPEVLHGALRDQETAWIGVALTVETDRLDIVLPQFQKAARTLTDDLERAGFPVRRHHVRPYDDETRLGMQWVSDAVELPATRTHRGPEVAKRANADRFRSKWQDHPDAVGPVQEEGGRMVVAVRVDQRTPRARLVAGLQRLSFGKHMQASLEHDPPVLDDPADVDPAWAPCVADLVLDRRPWQR